MDFSFSSFIQTEVPENELIVSRTDLKGVITYANDVFSKISGYEENELVGKKHSILRHPDMPKQIFKDLWQTIANKKIWRGYVKNLRKDGGFYWVYAEVSGVYKNNELVEYKSLRNRIDRATQIKMQNLYDRMRYEDREKQRVSLYLAYKFSVKLCSLAQKEGLSKEAYLEKLIAAQDL